MTERAASLHMYDMAEIEEAADVWWSGLADHFTDAGVANPPATLTRPGEGVDFWKRSDLLFSQTCGFPLVSDLSGEVTLIATPCYDAPGCSGPDYCSFVIVRNDAPYEELSDLRGGRCAVNDVHSWSGHHALRCMIASQRQTAGCFCESIITGSHAASVRAVADGAADFAAIDCVVYSNLSRHRPGAVDGVRVISRSPGMPGLPYIAGKAASAADIKAMKRGLAAAIADSRLAVARQTLGITGLRFTSASDYTRLVEALQQADQAGVGLLV